MTAIAALSAFLFTDIEGSTRLVTQLGTAYGALLQDHHRLLRSAFALHGGREHGTEGDAFFVSFPTADTAVNAALLAQELLAAHPWPVGSEVRVRMGIHVGTAQVRAGNQFGIDVNLAARVAAAAHGGQLLLSDPPPPQ